MSDTTPCAHHQFFGAREFCPDCGLSRTEVLVEACSPFLKDGETPAECIARNRRDVDGCLTMLIEERRKVEALRAERDALRDRENARIANEEAADAEWDAANSLIAALGWRLAEAEALLREWVACATNIGSGEAVAKVEQAFVAQCRTFLAASSATVKESARKPIPGRVPGHENCPKCDGHGWLWREELDDPGDWDGIADDTKYSCDWTPAESAAGDTGPSMRRGKSKN